jgi:superfamily II DNA helicase RecQ
MCHHANLISNIRSKYKENGVLLGKSLTEAANEVIKRQKDFSLSKTHDFTSLKAPLTLPHASKPQNSTIPTSSSKIGNESSLNKIINSILNWQQQEHIDPEIGFPKYILTMMLQNMGYNDTEIFNNINQIRKIGVLVSKGKDNYYLSSYPKV